MELRKINPIEVNKDVASLPCGVFGYSYGHSFANISKNYNNNFSRLIIEKRNPDDNEKHFFFEIRKYGPADIRLVGYVSDESQLSYNQNKGFSNNAIIVLPFSHKQFKNNMEIQLHNNPLSIQGRMIEDDDIRVIGILEITRFVPDEIKQNTKKVSISAPTNNKAGNTIFFLKKIAFHPTYSILFIAVITFLIYVMTGINLKDFLLSI